MSSHLDLLILSDEDLVEIAIRRGASDDRPFTILFERHRKLVWGICYRFTANTADAEDLLQDVFFKIYRNLRTFEGRSTFRTWLYQIALNTCRNELRYRRRRPVSIEANMNDIDLTDPVHLSREPASGQSELILNALLDLKPEQRAILIMRDMEEQPFTAIAEALGIQVGAAKVRVQRARLALVAALHTQEQTEEEA